MSIIIKCVCHQNRNIRRTNQNVIIGTLISFLFLFINLIMVFNYSLVEFANNLLGRNLEILSYSIVIILSKVIGFFILNKTIFSFGKIKSSTDKGILIYKYVLYSIYFFIVQFAWWFLVMISHLSWG